MVVETVMVVLLSREGGVAKGWRDSRVSNRQRSRQRDFRETYLFDYTPSLLLVVGVFDDRSSGVADVEVEGMFSNSRPLALVIC